MRKAVILLVWAGAVIALTTSVSAQTSGFMLIVNADNPVSSLSKTEVSDMFLKKTRRWDDGTPVVPINLGSESPARATFSLTIHDRKVTNIESYWQQQIFSGKTRPPLVVADDARMIEMVKADAGAIGYVSPNTTLIGVRVLSVMTPPEQLSHEPPRYTSLARRARVSGEVMLEIRIDSNGNVVDATPITELGFGLTREAIKAVNRWKFKPATFDGEPIEAVITVTVVFDLASG